MIYSSSKYRAKQTEIGNLRSFFALYHPKNPKNLNFVNENLLEISSFYTCAPKIRTILWCTILEIRSETNEKFCILEPFFALLSPTSRSRISKFWKIKKKKAGDFILLYIHVYHKWRSYDIWFLKCKVRQTEIFDIFGDFLPFQLLDNLENQNFDTEKKTLGDIIILNICTVNKNHMMYGSWEIEHKRHNFKKSKFSKEWKTHLKILSFYKHKWQSYNVWFLRY